jgi:hypothetical protein
MSATPAATPYYSMPYGMPYGMPAYGMPAYGMPVMAAPETATRDVGAEAPAPAPAPVAMDMSTMPFTMPIKTGPYNELGESLALMTSSCLLTLEQKCKIPSGDDRLGRRIRLGSLADAVHSMHPPGWNQLSEA